MSIVKVELNASNELVFTLSNDTIINVGHINFDTLEDRVTTLENNLSLIDIKRLVTPIGCDDIEDSTTDGVTTITDNSESFLRTILPSIREWNGTIKSIWINVRSSDGNFDYTYTATSFGISHLNVPFIACVDENGKAINIYDKYLTYSQNNTIAQLVNHCKSYSCNMLFKVYVERYMFEANGGEPFIYIIEGSPNGVYINNGAGEMALTSYFYDNTVRSITLTNSTDTDFTLLFDYADNARYIPITYGAETATYGESLMLGTDSIYISAINVTLTEDYISNAEHYGYNIEETIEEVKSAVLSALPRLFTPSSGATN